MSAPDNSMQSRALYRRADRRPGEAAERCVVLLARTGGRRNYRVRETGVAQPRVFGVYAFELFDLSTKTRVAQAVLDALPWRGAGADPLGTRAPVTGRLPATMVEGIDS